MLNALLAINFSDNEQIGSVVMALVICVAVGLIIATVILKVKDR